MKIVILKSGSIAINPQVIIKIEKGDVLGIGDKGTTSANFTRMIDLGIAEAVEAVEEVEEVEAVEAVEAVEEVEAIESKDELEAFALEFYDVELDKRKSLAKMKEALKLEIEKQVAE